MLSQTVRIKTLKVISIEVKTCWFGICDIIWAMYNIIFFNLKVLSISVASRSKVWVCGRTLSGIVGLNPASKAGV
jgi:hypothetical protein